MEELTAIQQYAAGALLGLALREAQAYQLSPVGFHYASDDEDGTRARAADTPESELWINERFGLLRPVFTYLKIDSKAWPGLEETAMTFPARHHIGAFLRILSEEEKEEKSSSSEGANSEAELAKAIDAMSTTFERTSLTPDKSSKISLLSKTQGAQKNNHGDPMEGTSKSCEETVEVCQKTSEGLNVRSIQNETIAEGKLLTHQRKMAVLFELLAACVADNSEEKKKKNSRLRKGYDARHRVALRLLATWLDVKWTKVAAMELMVACSAMAALKEREAQEQEAKAKKGKWSKWKRGGLIGAAALTGGVLLAVTGGLAAPAIAAGLGALAPTLGTIVPVIGASGFAAAATAAGSVVGRLPAFRIACSLLAHIKLWFLHVLCLVAVKLLQWPRRKNLEVVWFPPTRILCMFTSAKYGDVVGRLQISETREFKIDAQGPRIGFHKRQRVQIYLTMYRDLLNRRILRLGFKCLCAGTGKPKEMGGV